jgi:hypothetical protein
MSAVAVCASCIDYEERIKTLEAEVESLKQSKRKANKMLFHSNFTLSKKKKGPAFTMNRKELRVKETLVMFRELVDWLEAVLGSLPGDKQQYRDDFLSLVDSGVVLCNALAALFPEACKDRTAKQMHINAKPGSFLAHDNLSLFLSCLAMPEVGISKHFLFVSQDVLAPADMGRKVCICLLQLAKVAHEKTGSVLPRILVLESLTDEGEEGREGLDAEHKHGSPNAFQEPRDRELFDASIVRARGRLVAKNEEGLVEFVSAEDGKTTKQVQAYVLQDTVMIRFRGEWVHIDRFVSNYCAKAAPVKEVDPSGQKHGQSHSSPSVVSFSEHRPSVIIQRRKPSAAVSALQAAAAQAPEEETAEDQAHREEMEARKVCVCVRVCVFRGNE